MQKRLDTWKLHEVWLWSWFLWFDYFWLWQIWEPLEGYLMNLRGLGLLPRWNTLWLVWISVRHQGTREFENESLKMRNCYRRECFGIVRLVLQKHWSYRAMERVTIIIISGNTGATQWTGNYLCYEFVFIVLISSSTGMNCDVKSTSAGSVCFSVIIYLLITLWISGIRRIGNSWHVRAVGGYKKMDLSHGYAGSHDLTKFGICSYGDTNLMETMVWINELKVVEDLDNCVLWWGDYKSLLLVLPTFDISRGTWGTMSLVSIKYLNGNWLRSNFLAKVMVEENRWRLCFRCYMMGAKLTTGSGPWGPGRICWLAPRSLPPRPALTIYSCISRGQENGVSCATSILEALRTNVLSYIGSRGLNEYGC